MAVPKKKKNLTDDDDRNIVLVDGDFAEADLDDRAWLIWERYKRAILIGGLVVFVGGLGLILVNAFRASHAESLGAEYGQAVTPEQRLAFAQKNRGETLAAVAALESADTAYKAGDLKTAGDRFAIAEDLAKAARPVPEVMLGRAIVGRAVCALRSGDAAGKRRLDEVANDAAIAGGTRAHALFLLAENACGEKDFVSAKRYLDRIDGLSGASKWQIDSPRTALVAAFPALLTAGATPAPAAKK